MKGALPKYLLVAFGILFLLLAALLVFLVADFPEHAADHLIAQVVSPEGQKIAELHEIITPMHGGPDTLQVMLHAKNESPADLV
jgi:hypothetical protein